jgi:hypothetical protein
MKEENKLRKFKLIDKEGYLNNHVSNKEILETIKSDVFVGYEASGDIRNDDTPYKIIIDYYERKYFKEITDEQETSPSDENIYWQEGQPLTAGLIVGKNCSGDKEFFVKYVGDIYAVLSDKRGEYTSLITNLKSVVKSDKDVIFEEVLSMWKGSSLNNAYDNRNSVVHLGSFFDTVYQVMKEKERS